MREIDNGTLNHADGTPCAGSTCAWKDSGGHSTVHAAPCTLCSLGYKNAGTGLHVWATTEPKREIDQENLDRALSLLLGIKEDATSVYLQSSDQGTYGFRFHDVRDFYGSYGGDFESDYPDEIEQFNDLLVDVDWNGVVGEDKRGFASVDLTVYDTSNSASVQHFIDTGRYLRKGEISIADRDAVITLSVADASNLVYLLGIAVLKGNENETAERIIEAAQKAIRTAANDGFAI